MIPAFLLVASLVILFAGPLLHQHISTRGNILFAIDSFIFIAVTGLVLMHIIPESIEASGWRAALLVGIGLFVPLIIERSLHRVAHETHMISLVIAIVGLVFHAVIDGIALTGLLDHHTQTKHMIPLATVLHRLPDGLIIWHLLRPSYGVAIALGTLAIMALSTVMGFMFSDSIILYLPAHTLGLVQGLVAGSLLHVVIHQPHFGHTLAPTRSRMSIAGGSVLAIAFLLVLEPLDLHAHRTPFTHTFITLALESAPALVFAYLAAGVVHSFFPKAGLAWINRGNRLSQALRGVVFGLPLPICSCGVLPIYRGLILRGTSVGAAMAFLVATPELGLDALLLSFPLLGTPFTMARLVCAALTALLIGWIFSHVTIHAPDASHSDACLVPSSAPSLARVREGIHVGLGDMVDATAPWILIGLLIAASIDPLAASSWIQRIPAGWDVPLLGFLGIPLYVCASGATPLVAMLIASGISPGAALAFLLTGPATNVTTFGILSELHGKKIALAFGAAIALITIGLGYAANALLPPIHVFPIDPNVETLAHPFKILCLVILTALIATSLLRQGPRRFVGQVLPSADSTDSLDSPQNSH